MANWSLDDIPWQLFDRSKVSADMVSLAKAASMVEYNGHDYARYLNEVFSDDEEFMEAAREWAAEEVRHGEALRRWAELADPTFDFDKSFHTFVTGYKLPENVNASVRGSRTGELIARCIVEVGTSSYYTAIKEWTQEPVLQIIAGHIAADEFRHYKLFYKHLQRYLEKENIGMLGRLRVALGRIAESEDDELAYAYYAAHDADTMPYAHETYRNRMAAYTYPLYRRHHIDRMATMVLKAVGLKPNGMLGRTASGVAWKLVRRRAANVQPQAA